MWQSIILARNPSLAGTSFEAVAMNIRSLPARPRGLRRRSSEMARTMSGTQTARCCICIQNKRGRPLTIEPFFAMSARPVGRQRWCHTFRKWDTRCGTLACAPPLGGPTRETRRIAPFDAYRRRLRPPARSTLTSARPLPLMLTESRALCNSRSRHAVLPNRWAAGWRRWRQWRQQQRRRGTSYGRSWRRVRNRWRRAQDHRSVDEFDGCS